MSNAVPRVSNPMPNFSTIGVLRRRWYWLSAPTIRNAFWTGRKLIPGHCLFINPEIPILEDALADMSRAEWTDETGKYRVIKQPRLPGGPLPPSPDIFDAARLAYAYDARRGLPGRLK